VAERDCLIVLTVPPPLEEAVVDWLLGLDACNGFTTYPVSGHSGSSEGLTATEQVSARKQQVRFELHLAAAGVAPALERLRTEFRGTGIHFWTTPLDSQGTI
jgi:hypothetical protein